MHRQLTHAFAGWAPSLWDVSGTRCGGRPHSWVGLVTYHASAIDWVTNVPSATSNLANCSQLLPFWRGICFLTVNYRMSAIQGNRPWVRSEEAASPVLSSRQSSAYLHPWPRRQYLQNSLSPSMPFQCHHRDTTAGHGTVCPVTVLRPAPAAPISLRLHRL